MPAHRTRSRAPRIAIVGVLAAAAVAISPATAFAAPGEATARAVSADFVLTPADTGTTETILTTIGVVAAPPGASTSIPADSISADLGPTLGGVTDVLLFETIDAAASSDATGTAASASVGVVQMGTPAGILEIRDVSASVTCARGSGPSASTGGPSSVTLGGAPVALDPSGTTVIDLSSGADTFRVTLVAGGTSFGSGSATATGLRVVLEEDLTGIITGSGEMVLAEASCEALPTRTTSGTIRVAETGAPLSSVCVVWSPVSDPRVTTVLNGNGDGTFSFDTDEPGPINVGFFVPQNQYDCGSAVAPSPVASWLDGEAFTGIGGAAAIAPPGAQQITPGTQGIAACLGSAGPVASVDCVEPDVTLAGRVVGVDGSPERACIFVLGGPSNIAFGPYATAADGTWSVDGLPRDTSFAVAFLPYFDGTYGPCLSGGPPTAPAAGELQPVFFGNVWIDFTDPDLFADPRGWGTAHGATPVTGSTADVDGCLTTAPGGQTPRPMCAAAALASSGVDPVVPFAIAAVLMGLGAVVAVLSRRRRAGAHARRSHPGSGR
jgi:hypothetical protein